MSSTYPGRFTVIRRQLLIQRLYILHLNSRSLNAASMPRVTYARLMDRMQTTHSTRQQRIWQIAKFHRAKPSIRKTY